MIFSKCVRVTIVSNDSTNATVLQNKMTVRGATVPKSPMKHPAVEDYFCKILLDVVTFVKL
jgi:hypothetical protein